MAKFKIPVIWEMWGTVEVEADDLEEAKEKVISDETPLPTGEYISDSIQVDEEGIALYNEIEEVIDHSADTLLNHAAYHMEGL